MLEEDLWAGQIGFESKVDRFTTKVNKHGS